MCPHLCHVAVKHRGVLGAVRDHTGGDAGFVGGVLQHLASFLLPRSRLCSHACQLQYSCDLARKRGVAQSEDHPTRQCRWEKNIKSVLVDGRLLEIVGSSLVQKIWGDA